MVLYHGRAKDGLDLGTHGVRQVEPNDAGHGAIQADAAAMGPSVQTWANDRAHICRVQVDCALRS